MVDQFQEVLAGTSLAIKVSCLSHDGDNLPDEVRYVELNPVTATLCRISQDWCCSSADVQLIGRNDHAVQVEPMLDRVDDRVMYPGCNCVVGDGLLALHSRTWRTPGNARFISRPEALTWVVLARNSQEENRTPRINRYTIHGARYF